MSAGLLAPVLLALGVLLWPPGPRWARLRAPRPPIGARFARWRSRLRGRADGGPAVLAVVEAVATQVRAGAAPEVAWLAALDVLSETHEGCTALPRPGPGEPLAPALRRAVESGADPVLLSVAAAWQLADQVGAPLADVLDRLAAGLRQEAEVTAEIEASLAAPRATAKLLAVLPLAGIGLGELIGADPLTALTTTTVGRACAVLGLLLAVIGQVWTGRLVARTAALA